MFQLIKNNDANFTPKEASKVVNDDGNPLAYAADIISDLRNLKTASLAWYADNLDYVERKTQQNGHYFSKLSNEKADILKYLGYVHELNHSYSFSDGKDSGTWFVWRNVTAPMVFNKLKERADSVGLVLQGASNTTGTPLSKTKEKTGKVGLLIR